MVTIFGRHANKAIFAIMLVIALLALTFSAVEAKYKKGKIGKRAPTKSQEDDPPLVFSDTVCGGSDGYFCGKAQCCHNNGTCGWGDDFCSDDNCDGAHGFCNGGLGLTEETAFFLYRLFTHWPNLASATQPDPQYIDTNIGFGTEAWSSNISPDSCNWYGLSCGEDYDIEFVSFYNVNLGGTIPEFISELESLGVLSFVNTNIGGNLEALTGFEFIVQIDMSNNRINGTIPSSLFSNRDLSAFRVGNNQLTGTVPTFTSAMAEANMTHNSLSGSMSFYSDAAWDLVDISYNSFSGTLPSLISNFGGNTLVLSHNSLSGTIPDLSNLENLQVIDLSYNNLELCPSTTYLDAGTLCSLGNQGVSSCGCSDTVYANAGCTYDHIPSSCGSGSNGSPVAAHPNVAEGTPTDNSGSPAEDSGSPSGASGSPADSSGPNDPGSPLNAATTVSMSVLATLTGAVLLALAC